MKLPVFDLKGAKLEAWNFDEKSLGSVNEVLLAQALRVYESNSHQKTSKVKTRGEVNGTTKKIYRQKGTGNARHGARYAPIFVGGGIAFGPTGVRPNNLILPKKMRARALATSLLLKLQSSLVSGLDSVTKVEGKTSKLAELLNTIAGHPKNRVLVVTEDKADSLYRGLKNIQAVTMKRAALVNAYDLVYFDHLVVTKDALDSLVSRAMMKKIIVKPVAVVEKPSEVKKSAPKAVKTDVKSTPKAKTVKTVKAPKSTKETK